MQLSSHYPRQEVDYSIEYQPEPSFQSPVAPLDHHQVQLGDQLIALVNDYLGFEANRHPGMLRSVPALWDAKKVDLEPCLEAGGRLEEAVGFVPENVDHVHTL